MQAPAELNEKLFGEEYIKKCFESGVRPDARSLMQSRPVSIQYTPAGTCMVKIGASCAIASIKLTVGTPALVTPDQGELDIQVSLSGVCSVKFSTQRTTDEAQSLCSFLTRTILGSKCIDLNDCCIEKGKCAWKLNAEITFLDYDGNAIDTALLAIMSVLSKLTIPVISISPDSIVTLAADQSAQSKFPLHTMLISTTFGEYEKHLLVDPTAREEEYLSSTFTILSTIDGQFSGVYKTGGQPVGGKTLVECIRVAKERTEEIEKLIE